MSDEKKNSGFVPPPIKKEKETPAWLLRLAEERPAPQEQKPQTAPAGGKEKRPEVPSGNSAPKADNYEYYTIQKGDCLLKIAEKFGCTVEQLQEWNRLFNDADKDGVMDEGEKGYTKIYAGDKLRVGKKKPGGGW